MSPPAHRDDGLRPLRRARLRRRGRGAGRRHLHRRRARCAAGSSTLRPGPSRARSTCRTPTRTSRWSGGRSCCASAASADPSPERAWESLVVTEDDHIDYPGPGELEAAIPVTLTARLRRSHLLFLGYDLADWNLRLVVSRLRGGHAAPYASWAVRAAPSALELAFWRRLDVQAVEVDENAFAGLLDGRLDGMVDRMSEQLPASRPTRGWRRSRTPRSTRCSSSAASATSRSSAPTSSPRRLTVLYGPSGVGKSSLLAAAVARWLRELPEQPVVVVFSSWSDRPGGGDRRRGLLRGGHRADGLPRRGGRARLCRRGARSTSCSTRSRSTSSTTPRAARSSRSSPRSSAGRCGCNVLLSLREDALAKLDRFKASIPGILDNYLRLDRLSREAGRAAVVQPLARWHELGGEPVEIEPALVEAVLDQVAAGRIRAGLGGSGQVAEDAARGDGSRRRTSSSCWSGSGRSSGRRDRRRCALATLEQLGGAAQIVAAHLERAMDALTPAQQEIASELLRQLVTPSGAKIAHAAADLAGLRGRAGGGGARGPRRARGPAHPAPGETTERYEIYHDVLAAPILAWRARYVHAQELVEAHRRNRRLAVVATAAVAALVVTALVAVFALVQRSNARADARAAHARELDAAARVGAPDRSGARPPARPGFGRRSRPTPTAEDVLRQALTTSRLRAVVARREAAPGRGRRRREGRDRGATTAACS